MMTALRGWLRQRTLAVCCGALALLAMVGVVGWLYHQTERQLRHSLLQQAELVAASVNPERVRALSGTQQDLTKPEYLKLREQLSLVRAAEAKYRFVYLMGRRAEAEVFFLVDGDLEEPAAPGTAYPDASPEFRAVFDTGKSFVEGPLPDEWGVWISATVPILDPGSGRVLAVLGMDCDAADWRWEILSRIAWPAGAGGLVLGGMAAGIVLLRRRAADAGAVVSPLLLPLTGTLLLLIAGSVSLLTLQHKQELDQSSQQLLTNSAADLAFVFGQQRQALEALEEALARDEALPRGLQARDGAALLAQFGVVFQRLQTMMHVTHFYLLDPDLNVVVRIHDPAEKRARSVRKTAQEAVKKGGVASGIEVGLRGTVALRVVRPVFVGQTLVGYIELGQQIDGLLDAVHEKSGTELILLLRKDAFSPEAARQMKERVRDWDRLPDKVALYATLALPAQAQTLLRRSGEALGSLPEDYYFGGRVWRALVSPLNDSAGDGIGECLLLRDITTMRDAHRQMVWLTIFTGLLILCGLCGGLYAVLRRLDNRLRSQIAMIRDGEERYYVLFSDSPDAYLILNDTGVASCNRSACEMFRCALPDLLGVAPASFSPPQQPDATVSANALSRWFAKAQTTGKTAFDWQFRRFDGSLFWCEVAASPITVHGVAMLFLALRDITERQNARERLIQAERMSAIGLLAAGVAHNFNNLHGGILGSLELLERKETLSEAGHKKIAMISSALQRAVDLTENILLLCSRRRDNRTPLAIAHLIRNTVEVVRPEYTQDNILFDMSLDDSVRVCCNGAEICHVILNLLMNARDAMTGSKTRRIRLECCRQDGRAVVRVGDTGGGISPEDQDRLFLPFFSTKGVYAHHGSPQAELEGTGLGLCCSKAVVEAHGGEIVVESTSEQGTIIAFRLPLAPASGDASAGHAGAAKA